MPPGTQAPTPAQENARRMWNAWNAGMPGMPLLTMYYSRIIIIISSFFLARLCAG